MQICTDIHHSIKISTYTFNFIYFKFTFHPRSIYSQAPKIHTRVSLFSTKETWSQQNEIKNSRQYFPREMSIFCYLTSNFVVKCARGHGVEHASQSSDIPKVCGYDMVYGNRHTLLRCLIGFDGYGTSYDIWRRVTWFLFSRNIHINICNREIILHIQSISFTSCLAPIIELYTFI
jgi:hypothetical protein